MPSPVGLAGTPARLSITVANDPATALRPPNRHCHHGLTGVGNGKFRQPRSAAGASRLGGRRTAPDRSGGGRGVTFVRWLLDPGRAPALLSARMLLEGRERPG